MSGKLPTQLLDDLETHRFRSFGIVGAEVNVDESPTVFSCDFRAKAIHVVIRALNSDNVCAENQRTKNFAWFQIRRYQDKALQPRRSCIGRDRICKISGRRACHGTYPKLFGPAKSDRDNAILKGEGGIIDRVVLYVKLPDTEVPR